ncbi:hypothetical protein LINPERPRIM_LOCUS23403 [Linum perenne]
MAAKYNPSSLFLALLFLPSLFSAVEGGLRKFHITDDLSDVVDDEEDEAWKEWGKKKTDDEFDPPPSDMSNMGIEEIQEALMKRNMAPVFGFIKLRVGVKRTPVNPKKRNPPLPPSLPPSSRFIPSISDSSLMITLL